MEIKRIAMSIEAYRLMEHPFGYKAEYWDGTAVITPRELSVTAHKPITQRAVVAAPSLLPVQSAFATEMSEAFFAAFHGSVEFCGWAEADIRQHAAKNINGYFAGKRGEPHPASVMSLAADGTVAGLALLLTDSDGAVHLDLLFVAPAFQRNKLATAMVASAVNYLHERGVEELYSAYHICNAASQQWHHAFGFQDVYDEFYVRLKCAWFQHEIWRYEKLGLGDEVEALLGERDCWCKDFAANISSYG